MSENRQQRRNKNEQPSESQPAQESKHTVQNARPAVQWQTFEQCWHSCVRNGTPLLMESCKAHLRAMGWLNQPSKWIEGMMHFGIKVEK